MSKTKHFSALFGLGETEHFSKKWSIKVERFSGEINCIVYKSLLRLQNDQE